MKLGLQFTRLNSQSGRRGGSRSEPWMTSSAPTKTFHGKGTLRLREPRTSTLSRSIARSGRGRGDR